MIKPMTMPKTMDRTRRASGDIEADGRAGVGDGQDVDGGTDKQEGDGRSQPGAALPDAGEQRQDGAGAHRQDEATKAEAG